MSQTDARGTWGGVVGGLLEIMNRAVEWNRIF